MMWILLVALALPVHTPGAVRPLSVREVCATHWSADRRHVTERMKRTVAAQYGLPWKNRRTVEFDHLVPRELGGADVIENLWPQPLTEARRKDRDENRLHQAVCAGTVSLTAAQDAMRRWGRLR